MEPYRLIRYRSPLGRKEEILDVLASGERREIATLLDAQIRSLPAGKAWVTPGIRVTCHPRDLRITRLPNFGFGSGIETDADRWRVLLSQIRWYTLGEQIPRIGVTDKIAFYLDTGEVIPPPALELVARDLVWQFAVVQITHDRGSK